MRKADIKKAALVRSVARIQRTSLAPEEANENRYGQRSGLGDQAAAVEFQPQPFMRFVSNTWQITALGLRRFVDMTHDTGAAISAFPLDAKICTETEANACTYKAASGELNHAHGG